MAIRKLTIDEQINFLTIVRDKFVNRTFEYGMCNELYHINGFPKVRILGNIKNYIQGFSLENAIELSVKYGFLRPTGDRNWYWWSISTYSGLNARVDFLNALITELKIKQENGSK